MKTSAKSFCSYLLGALLLCFSSQIFASSALSYSAAIGADIVKQFKTGKLEIKTIIVEEPHIIPATVLDEVLKEYQGTEISVVELKEIQNKLSRYYFDQGYINSGITIPDQDIENGIIKLKPVHGRLTQIKIDGNTRISNRYIHDQLATGISVPLNANQLQTALNSLQQHPLIEDLSANISPGKELGQSILHLSLKESRAYVISATLDNNQSPSIGAYKAGISLAHYDATGHRDFAQLSLGATEGLLDSNLHYSLPFRSDAWFLGMHLQYSQFKIIEDDFASADIRSKTQIAGVNLKSVFYRGLRTQMSLSAGLDIKQMELTMFGEPVTFIEGVVDGESKSSPFLLNLRANTRNNHFAAAIDLGLRRGTNLGISDDAAQQVDYTVGTGQLYLAKRFHPLMEWSVSLNSQLSADALPPLEKFALGGSRTVRGFRENLLVRDSGLVISTQVRVSVWQHKIFISPFVDYGKSWNRESGFYGNRADEITGLGIGFQWRATRSMLAELNWGYAANSTLAKENYSHSIEQPIHFALQYTW